MPARRLPLLLLALLLLPIAAFARPPLRDGEYVFHHRSAEHPRLPAHPLVARIRGHHIVLMNRTHSSRFPVGIVAEGDLMWHAASKQWILGHTSAHRTAVEVGGCSDGPEVVDVGKRIYWTC